MCPQTRMIADLVTQDRTLEGLACEQTPCLVRTKKKESAREATRLCGLPEWLQWPRLHRPRREGGQS